MRQTGVIILAHGSRGQQGIVEVSETLTRVTGGIRPLLPAGVEVTGAALQFNHPSLEEAVASLAVQGVQQIVIVPYFLFSGRHITEDIPRLIEGFKSQYPEIKFIAANTLGNDELFTGLVVKRIEEAVPELWSNAPPPPTSPEDIERQSMEIVRRLLPPLPDLTGDERLVVTRIVHASGDHQIAPLIKFSPSATSNGINAIAKGSPIFTDVKMVAAGINRHIAGAFGCSVTCAMGKAEGQKQAKEQNLTRAGAAIRHLGTRLNEAIVAIGNAPTALLALLDLVDHEGIKPALVVGMPVGFVRAKESKGELRKRDIPYITIIGTRGGSAMAAATVNALLRIAQERNSPINRFDPQRKEAY